MTARPRGGRASARGASAKIMAGAMGVAIMENNNPYRRRAYPPEERLEILGKQYEQLKLAYENTGSITAFKKMRIVEAHINVARAELALPSIW